LNTPALLRLKDGSLFWGRSIGVTGCTTGEVVFNTSMTGYQEIITDPSYARQIITFTYPHIGNVGMNPDDEESPAVFASGLVIRDLPLVASNWRSRISLGEYLQQKKLVAIADIDTRRLTRILREKGAQPGCIMAGDNINEQAALDQAQSFPGLQGMDLAKEVSRTSIQQWTQSTWTLAGMPSPLSWDSPEHRFHVVAYDFGIKTNILRMLVERGCKVTLVPATTSATDVMALQPDGIFLSNGPGDPEPCDYAIEAIASLLKTGKPIFGICLGHQLLSLASGAKTMKMKFGHHGGNHPVQDLRSKVVMITSQNHGFAVDEKSLPSNLMPTHRSLFDDSLQGVARTDCPAFSFQGHPEASPGPHDVAPLFDHFIELMNSAH